MRQTSIIVISSRWLLSSSGHHLRVILVSTFNLILQRFLLSPLLRRSSLDLIFKSMPYRIVGSLEYYIHGGGRSGQWTAAQHATTNNRLGDVVDKDKPLARLLERDGRKTNIKALKGCCCMLLRLFISSSSSSFMSENFDLFCHSTRTEYNQLC